MTADFLSNNFIRDIAVATISILLGVWVPAYFSFRRFRSQQWWEKKAVAYQEAISVFGHQKWYFEKLFEDELLRKEVTENARKELNTEFAKARKKLEKIRFESAFLFSNDSQASLNMYFSEIDASPQFNTYFESLDHSAALTDRAMERFIVFAKKDLRV